uniref:NADH dehydrogenase subunit 6 n=1 Tax=Neoseiulus californicus TaxID=84382 RepID=UPI0022DCD9BC|nr:NADH dehydrogenase subunit 6 [Neoseiulus californicus]UZU69614.1 NADH dehydrogenase subunit 6 [Neoseiulus californicus]WJN56894.1 NADH dehydrogenase subunit 6 [Neoseiulus californicus]WKV28864.1 NADH dehydrogenase subunit 6 [Neoseiulus californicus]
MLMTIKMTLILLTSFFTFNSAPLTKIFILMMNILFMALIFSFLTKTSWFLLMFILLMIGGLMILFIYFTSLYKEKKMNFKKSMVIMIIMLFFTISQKKLYFIISTNLENKFLNFLSSFNFSLLMTLLIFYMLTLLIFYLELISNMKTSFRSKIN